VRKTFPFSQAGKQPERVLDTIKHEIRQYLKRERRKALPDDADYWDFDCQLGPTAEQAHSVHPGNLIAAVDDLARQGLPSFHLVLLAKPAVRQHKASAQAHEDDASDPQD
jgi:hypothetical protein